MNEVFLKISQNWEVLDWKIALLIFCAYFVIDILYARYTYSVVKLKAASAANIASIMYFLLALGVLNYVRNFLYVIPVAAGSWLGTYLVVKMEQRKNSGRG